MKTLDQLEHTIEVWARGKWMSCPDVRCLEVGDIIRYRSAKTGKLEKVEFFQEHVVKQSVRLLTRAPTLREYQTITAP